MSKPLEIKFFRGFLLTIFFLAFSGISCAKPQQQRDDFFQGLLIKTNAHHRGNMAAHFVRALDDPNVYVRQAAADELAYLMYYGTEFSPKNMQKIRREAAGAWAAAFEAVDAMHDKDKALTFLLSFQQGMAYPAESRLYVLREFEKHRTAHFTETELAAIDGHFAVSRQNYNEALACFRKFMEQPEIPAEIPVDIPPQWPLQIPSMFSRYPNLINDLGQAFQYTSSGNEGRELFLRWEEGLVRDIALNEETEISGADSLRFRLKFYAARVARRRGANEQALALFDQARQLVPKGEQLDACNWYILDLALNTSSRVFLQWLEQVVPSWDKAVYFDDILEKFFQSLSAKKEWGNLIRTFELIKDTDAATKSGYAWKIARLIEGKYLSANELKAAAAAAGAEEASSAAFARIAYNASYRNETFSQYYRSLSAAALELPFIELAETAPDVKNAKPSFASQFLLNFFKYDMADLSVRYIRALENELPAEDLRAVTQAFAKEGMYALSIRQASRYINREGYVPTREDIELLFPRPFQDIIEQYSSEHNVPVPVLYGLIRTESAFQSSVVSRAGAVGLTQLMPETARDVANRIRRAGGPDFFDEQRSLNLTDPSLNVYMGAYFLNSLIVRFNDTLIALMAYNGGPNRVRRLWAASNMPSDLFLESVSITETRDYGRKVIGAAAVYKELYYK